MTKTSDRFPCPLCGGNMHVAETRSNFGGLRRRRRCTTPTCRGRITTQEFVVRVDHLGERPRPFDGEHVMLPRKLFQRLLEVAQELQGMAAQIEYSDPALANVSHETVDADHG